MLDTRVSSKLCTYYRTSSSGLAWPCRCRCRKQLAIANDASNMEALMLKCQCSPSLPPLLWSCYNVDFMSIEMTMELDQQPNVVNVPVFCNHFMKHIMAYVTPNLTVRTVAKFMWQGYISIFRAPANLLND